MKQNKKAKICFVICFAGKKKLLFYIYAVIVKQNFYKRSSNYYSRRHGRSRHLFSRGRWCRYGIQHAGGHLVLPRAAPEPPSGVKRPARDRVDVEDSLLKIQQLEIRPKFDQQLNIK
jgi:hypothetical protein